MSNHFFVGDTARGWVVRPEELISIEAEGNYSRVKLDNGQNVLVRRAVSALAAKLGLFRANRTIYVNLAAISEVTIYDSKRYAFKMRDGEMVVLSRRGSMELRALSL